MKKNQKGTLLVTGYRNLAIPRLLTTLHKAGWDIRLYNTFTPDDLPDFVTFYEGTLEDDDTLRNATADVDVIIHSLERHAPGKKSRGYMKQLNIDGTRNLANAALEAGVSHFIYISSYQVYGRNKKIPIRTDDRKRPVTRYGKDKLKAEKILWALYDEQSLPLTVIRPALVLGPRSDNTMILLSLYMAMGLGNDNRVYLSGNGNTRFQLLHPDDLISAITRVIEKDTEKGHVYNVGSDEVPTQLEQIVHVKDAAGLDATVHHISPKGARLLSLLLRPLHIHYLTPEHLFFLTQNLLLDNQRIKEDLGWAPKKGNIEIMKETIDWYQKEKL